MELSSGPSQNLGESIQTARELIFPPTNRATSSILKEDSMDGRKDKDNRVIKQDEIQ